MKNKPSQFGSGPRHEILLLSVLAGIIILVYAQTLTTPFIFDDINNIRENHHIRVPQLSLKNLAWAGFQSPLAKRPVANISFALNYYFHGYNLVGYHVVNILIHLAAGFILYFLVKATLQTPALRDQNANYGWIPFFTVFIWLAHPLQTQSVTYIVQRMNSMAAMFYVLSMLLYVKFRLATNYRGKGLRLIGCIIAGLLAFGSKEISATLPGFIILYEWYFFQGLSRQWGRRHWLILFGFGLFIILILLAYFENNPITRILGDYSSRDFTLGQRVLTQFRVVVFYISLLIWPKPSRLNLDHDFVLSYSLTNPLTTLFAMTIIIVSIILAILVVKREPLLSFGILWYFGNLVIESSVIGLELVFEHRNYLPSMLAILGAISLVFKYLKPTWVGVIALCLLGILFTGWTYERNRVWTDDITLYRDSLQKAPGKARPHNNLGAVLMRQNRLAEAIDFFKAALLIKPDYADAHYNLGYSLSRQGNLEAGIHHFAETLRLEPKYLKALNNMGVALALQGRYAEAEDYLKAALKLNPRDADIHNNLGFALKNNGNQDAAAQHFMRALDLDSRHAGAHNNLGLVLKEKGQIEAAYHHFTSALEINPNFAAARRNLAQIAEQVPKPAKRCK